MPGSARTLTGIMAKLNLTIFTSGDLTELWPSQSWTFSSAQHKDPYALRESIRQVIEDTTLVLDTEAAWSVVDRLLEETREEYEHGSVEPSNKETTSLQHERTLTGTSPLNVNLMLEAEVIPVLQLHDPNFMFRSGIGPMPSRPWTKIGDGAAATAGVQYRWKTDFARMGVYRGVQAGIF
ncbi:hypothetical protein OE88DRAFT_1644913 [Heliocybe sulcata]|uniref:Uncharacterized protein n=1 Tax=Heliocybe sulcata TaxID=5364 RepID=A0A5C3N1Y7_9AGAM|nr:hypothetical protein OE88DRAFT_1644913 [Heliocybe sulcata]